MVSSYGSSVSFLCLIVYSFVDLYLFVSGSITTVGEERADLSAIFYTCNKVVYVCRGLLFLWVLCMGCVISL